MIRAATILLFVLVAAGCAGGEGSGTPDRPSGPEKPRELPVERVSSGAPGQGPVRPRVIIASSAEVLSREIGGNVPDSGEGTYMAVYWGRKPTGGYSLAVESARLEGNTVTVTLATKEPSPDAMVTQALTYPYAVATLEDLDPEGKRFDFADEEGRKLDWEVRLARVPS
jgi:hypothetical protein